MSKINETNYPRRTQASYEDTDMLVIQESGGNTYTTRIEDLRDDYEATLAPTIDKINDALAPAENGATASQSYAIGEHFMRDGAFCTAIAAITSGGSFTLNTNYKVDDVANNLEQLNSDLASVASLSSAFYFGSYTCTSGTTSPSYAWASGTITKPGYIALSMTVGSGYGYSTHPVVEAMSGLGTDSVAAVGSCTRASTEIRVWVLWVKANLLA